MRRMSMLFQRPATFNTSVFNNVAYGLVIRRVDKKTIEKKVIDALALVGLAGYEKQKALTIRKSRYSHTRMMQGTMHL